MEDETWEAAVVRITEGGSRMVSLKDVLEACLDAYDLGDWRRYMPWRFANICTSDECRELDHAMHTRRVEA